LFDRTGIETLTPAACKNRIHSISACIIEKEIPIFDQIAQEVIPELRKQHS
jgi:hypothetical protein